jgi:hypothetical protein
MSEPEQDNDLTKLSQLRFLSPLKKRSPPPGDEPERPVPSLPWPDDSAATRPEPEPGLRERLKKAIALGGAGLTGIAAGMAVEHNMVQVQSLQQQQNALQTAGSMALHLLQGAQIHLENGEIQVTLKPETVVCLTTALVVWHFGARKIFAKKEDCIQWMQQRHEPGEVSRLLASVTPGPVAADLMLMMGDRFIQDAAAEVLIHEGWPPTQAVSMIQGLWRMVESEQQNQERFQVFLSYGRQDIATAVELTQELAKAQYHVFRDQDCLVAGDVWAKQILLAILRSLLTVVLLSRSSLQSVNVLEEGMVGAIAQSAGNRSLIPVTIEDIDMRTVPRCLSNFQLLSLQQCGGIPALAVQLGERIRLL